MNLRWIVISITIIVCTLFQGFAQVVTTDPAFPTATDQVIVYFDASEGNQELEDFTGDIYAHTGVITDESSGPSDWKYVIAAWDENTEKAKLTKVSSNLYKLEIDPSIKEFYGVAEDEEILKMAFVFRNSDGSKVAREADGSDIYATVYEPGLSINISSPTDDYIILPGEQVLINALSNDADTMSVYIDDVLISKLAATTIGYTHTENVAGSHKIKIYAKNSEEEVSDSVYYYARGSVNQEFLPDGWKKGINYLEDDSVGLVLFAPNKDFIFVIGDFTDWRLDEEFMMNKEPDSYYFWLAVGDLTPQEEYIFQYYIDGELRIADPYTEKTSDPNDKSISENTYPGLIDYPANDTKEIASVLQTNQADYEWVNTDFVAPAKEKLIIYELLVRDFIANHDYKTLTDTLDYLDSLGITAIELMPFNEFEGNESWGYNPSFYFAPDKYYGPKEDLKEFIDSCHGRGIAIIMDMVLNHSYGQSPLVRMYFDGEKPTAENPWYNVQSPNSTYSWGYDFDHESVYTKEFVDSVNRFWLEKYKVDGFRFDFTKGFTNTPGDGGAYDNARINILKRMAIVIWDVNPNAYVILEHLAENSEEKNLADFGMMLWGNINYDYNEATMGYDSDIDWVSYQERTWNEPNLVAYMESHDEERLMFKNIEYGNSTDEYNIKNLYTGLHRIELAANFFIPIPGPKMIWQFGEIGYDYSIDYDCRVCNKPIRWDYFTSNRKRLYYVFKALNNLKTEYDVFSTDNFEITQTGKLKSIHLFDSEMDVVILGNFDVETQEINPEFPTTGDWYEFYSGDTLSVTGTDELISLLPGEYRLYTNTKLEDPNIPASIFRLNSETKAINVFPNPSSDVFYFDVNDKIHNDAVFYLYDIQGQLRYEDLIASSEIFELDATLLDNGIYFYKLISENNIYTGKILKE
ncbi:alpha-amylase family glycosyl hydrolase [Bacteroidota bacterium]